MDYNYMAYTSVNEARLMVLRVIRKAEEYFPRAKVEAVWETRDRMSRPIRVVIHPTEYGNYDEVMDNLDKFDDEWWMLQDDDYHKLIGINLG